MPLPIAIDDLLNGKTVEWERLELKAGWNPLAVVHSSSSGSGSGSGAGRCGRRRVGSNSAGYEGPLNLVRQ